MAITIKKENTSKRTRKEKLRLAARITALILSAAACASSLICMQYYLNITDRALSSIVLLPFLIVDLAIVAIISVTTFQNLRFHLNKLTFLFNLVSVVFIIICFIHLYQ